MDNKLDEIRIEILEAEDEGNTAELERLWSEYHKEKYKRNTKKCPKCGESIYTGGEGRVGAYECCECGTWINKGGQQLLPPNEWGDEPLNEDE